MLEKRVIPISSLVFVLAMSFAVPFASAGPGEWDSLGGETVYEFGSTYRSGGGNYKVERSRYDTGSCDTFQLWEYDVESPNDYVGQASICPGGSAVFSVGGVTDGWDGKAELFVQKTYNVGKASYYSYYD